MIGDTFTRGSVWRKWDLHIHSPVTILNNQYARLPDGTPDWEAFIKKLESLDVAVVAITDYFTIDGYKKVKEFKANGRLNNIHTILPNIEFRLDKILASKKDGQQPRRLNFHVIFSDEVSDQDIEEHFLHDIDFFLEGQPQDQDQKRKLKASNLAHLGQKRKAEHKPFRDSGESDLVIGAMQAVVSHEDITRRLLDSRFKGKYLLIFPEEYSNLIDWDGQDHNTRKGLLQKSDMVFSASDKTRNWCIGETPYAEGPDKYVEEFKSLKPCVHGSDAHALDDIGRPCALRGAKDHKCKPDASECDLRYCWIKADPTFEGLKQLLYEPQDRVVIQHVDPTPPRSNFTLDEVKISAASVNADLSVSATALPLNHGLVAVTGGKGSGKTAFLDLIANCYLNRRESKDANSFVRRIADECPNVETTLGLKDGTAFTKRLSEKRFFENTELVYIAQGELENYISDESDLSDYIRSLIFESPQVRNTVASFEFAELTKKEDALASELVSRNEAVVRLEKDLSPAVLQGIALERKQKEAELKDVDARIAEYEKAQSAERVQQAKDQQKALGDLKTQKDELLHLRDLLAAARGFLSADLADFNNNLAEINASLSALKIGETFSPLAYPQTTALDARSTDVDGRIATVVQKIDSAQKEASKLEAGVQEHTNTLDRKLGLAKAIDRITSREALLETKKQDLKAAVAARKESYRQGVETALSLRAKYEELIQAFSSQKADVLSDLNFSADIGVDSEALLKLASEVLDNRRVEVRGNEQVPSIFEALVSLLQRVSKGEQAAIDPLLAEVERLDSAYRGHLKQAQTISIANFYSCLYANYLRVSPAVKYKNTQLSKLSLGQKATVLIKIYLAQGQKPIIIDSHDDHLDNEFIMDELVKAIRQAKQYRQVILASNNGNVVVNSDAEQLVVANRLDGKISYDAGALEDPKIRERAIKVLEGGAKAFKQRQSKYRIQY